jgi:hypothetical protein
VLAARRLAVDADRNEHDEKRRACVGHGEFLLTHVDHIDAELLVQLSTRRVGVRFTRLTLPTREFPQTTVPLLERPLAHKEFISARYDRGDDTNDLIRH